MDKDDKLVLLEHLRQLNDTLTRLSSRRRRLRAERRVRLGQLKNTMTFILSFVLTALAAVLAFFGLPILPIEALLSRLWTGFFDTARCRYTEKFSKPRFQPKMA